MDANREAALKAAAAQALSEMSVAEKAILSVGAIPLSIGSLLAKKGYSKNEYTGALLGAGGGAA